MKSRAKVGFALGVLGFCALAFFLFWQLHRPPQVGENFAQLSPAEQEQRRTEANRLVEQFNGIAESAKRKEGKDFSVTATEPQLNTLLQDRLKTEKFPIRDLRVGLEPNRLLVQGHVSYKGLETVATLGGNVVAQNGQLMFQVDSLQLGGLPAPSSLRRKVEREAAGKLNEALKDLPGRINRVTIEQNLLTIEGVTD